MSADVLLIANLVEAGQVWEMILNQAGFEVATLDDFDEAAEWLTKRFCDLILADWRSHESDLMDALQRLRPRTTVPIVLLLEGRDDQHLLECYSAGADDCIPRPVDPLILVAKLRAWQRRTWGVALDVEDVSAGGFKLCVEKQHVVAPGGTVVRLTNLEFRLLHLLMLHAGEVLKTRLIVDRVWGYSWNEDNSLVKHVIYRLRQKIEPDPTRPRYVLSAAGGYVFQP